MLCRIKGMESFLLDMVKNNAVSVVSLFFGLWFISKSLELNKSEIIKNTIALGETTKELNKACLAIVKLEVQMETFGKVPGRIDRIEKGMTHLFDQKKIKEK